MTKEIKRRERGVIFLVDNKNRGNGREKEEDPVREAIKKGRKRKKGNQNQNQNPDQNHQNAAMVAVVGRNQEVEVGRSQEVLAVDLRIALNLSIFKMKKIPQKKRGESY